MEVVHENQYDFESRFGENNSLIHLGDLKSLRSRKPEDEPSDDGDDSS